MSNIEIFLSKYFLKMPPWIRNLTYLVMLLVFVYFIFLPKELNGSVVVKDTDGSEYAFEKVTIGYLESSHSISARSGAEGQWGLPLISNTLKGYELRFTINEKISPIPVSAKEVFMRQDIQVFYDKNSQRFYRPLPKGQIESFRDAPQEVSFDFSPITKANAQESSFKPLTEVSLSEQKRIARQTVEQFQAKVDVEDKLQIINRANQQYNLGLGNSIAFQSSTEDAMKAAESSAVDAYFQNLQTQQKPVYMYYGEVTNDLGWNERFFSALKDPESSVPDKGDSIKALAQVHKRAGYIKQGWLGWENPLSLGTTLAGETFIVEETQRIGPYIWVKGYPISQ